MIGLLGLCIGVVLVNGCLGGIEVLLCLNELCYIEVKTDSVVDLYIVVLLESILTCKGIFRLFGICNNNVTYLVHIHLVDKLFLVVKSGDYLVGLTVLVNDKVAVSTNCIVPNVVLTLYTVKDEVVERFVSVEEVKDLCALELAVGLLGDCEAMLENVLGIKCGKCHGNDLIFVAVDLSNLGTALEVTYCKGLVSICLGSVVACELIALENLDLIDGAESAVILGSEDVAHLGIRACCAVVPRAIVSTCDNREIVGDVTVSVSSEELSVNDVKLAGEGLERNVLVAKYLANKTEKVLTILINQRVYICSGVLCTAENLFIKKYVGILADSTVNGNHIVLSAKILCLLHKVSVDDCLKLLSGTVDLRRHILEISLISIVKISVVSAEIEYIYLKFLNGGIPGLRETVFVNVYRLLVLLTNAFVLKETLLLGKICLKLCVILFRCKILEVHTNLEFLLGDRIYSLFHKLFLLCAYRLLGNEIHSKSYSTLGCLLTYLLHNLRSVFLSTADEAECQHKCAQKETKYSLFHFFLPNNSHRHTSR